MQRAIRTALFTAIRNLGFYYYRLVYSFLCTLFNTASSAAHQISLCRRVLGSNPGLLRLWHWQPDALHHSARFHPQCTVAMIPFPPQLFLRFLDGKRRQKFFSSLSNNNVTKLPWATLFATILVSFRPHFSSARWVCTWPNHYSPLAPSYCAPSTHSFTQSP